MLLAPQVAVVGSHEPPPLDVATVALFLDLDGTLHSLAPRPEDVEADAGLNLMLRGLGERLDGRLAVISGRTVADVDRILDGVVASVAGVHGLERRGADGRIEGTEPSTGVRAALSELESFASGRAGLIVENKQSAVTIHYRQAPEHGAAARALAAAQAARHDLQLQHGDMVAELKTPGAHKGAAVLAIMEAPPFAGAKPVFVGDDLTDEDGFEAAAALGGHGVLVASERPSAAAYRLRDVAAVRAWLQAALR